MAENNKSPRIQSPTRKRNQALSLVLIGLVVGLGAIMLFRNSAPEPQPEPVPSDIAVADAFYMPGEFHPQEFLMVGGTQLVGLYPDVLTRIVKEASPEIRILILAGSSSDEALISDLLISKGIPTGKVDLMTIPTKTMWVRDFGPATVSDRDGARSMVDFHYRERRGNAIDNGVPPFVSEALGFNLMGTRLLVEGGDYLSNGRGLCLLSTRVINRNAHYLVMDPDETMANFAAILGFENLLLLPPLIGETTGHVDMFCTLLEPDLAVVGRYDQSADPENAAHLEGIVERLKDFPTLDGPMKVERIPMPPHEDGVWRTYTNIVLANGVVLVPIYPDFSPELDRIALETYGRLMPDRRVVGIDASGLIRMNGALRCITMNIPRSFPLTVE